MTGAAGNRRLLERAISAALAIGRVDDAPYAAIAYLRRCLDAAPMISAAEILTINGFVTDPAGETWCTALQALADFWSRKMCEHQEAARRAAPEGIGEGAAPPSRGATAMPPTAV
jgi:hypothetical protein